MIPVSLFKCVWSHANVVLCVACINCCFVYNVLTHSLVLQWAFVLVLNVTHATVTDLIVKFLLKILCNLWPIGKCLS